MNLCVAVWLTRLLHADQHLNFYSVRILPITSTSIQRIHSFPASTPVAKPSKPICSSAQKDGIMHRYRMNSPDAVASSNRNSGKFPVIQSHHKTKCKL